MSLVHCTWDEENLGCRVYEATIKGCHDPVFDEIASTDYQYLVVKTPIADLNLSKKLSREGYTFIESQISYEKSCKNFFKSLGTERLIVNALELQLGGNYEDILGRITPGMFNTDRIALDDRFGLEYSQKRYSNWIRSASASDHVLAEFSYKDLNQVGFFFGREIGQNFHSYLGGIYPEYMKYGLGMAIMIAPLIYCRQKNLKKVMTKVSSNNIDVIKLYDHLNFRITDISYVYIRHQE